MSGLTSEKIMNLIIIGTGIFLIVLAGGRFLVDPVGAQSAFGIANVDTGDNYSFHYIKGIRDLIIGVYFLILVAYRHHKLLGWFLAVSGVIAATDAWVVLGYNDGHGVLDAWMHLTALPICIVGAWFYLMRSSTAATVSPAERVGQLG
ncbi:MAG: DUF4267 domain-containing protein [Actinomycetota bacterium]